MIIKQYDKIVLKDDRTATVVEILEDGVAYLVDVDLPGPDWDTIEIRHDDIKRKMNYRIRHILARILFN